MTTGADDNGQSKGKILGQPRGLRADEAEEITQMKIGRASCRERV